MSAEDRMVDEYTYVDYVMGLAVKMFTDARSRVRSPGLYLSLNSLVNDIEDYESGHGG